MMLDGLGIGKELQVVFGREARDEGEVCRWREGDGSGGGSDEDVTSSKLGGLKHVRGTFCVDEQVGVKSQWMAV